MGPRAKYVAFQLAEVAVTWRLFAAILAPDRVLGDPATVCRWPIQLSRSAREKRG